MSVDSDKYDIDLTAEYNKSESKIDFTLVNKTEKYYAFQDGEYSIYSEVDGVWGCIMDNKSQFSTKMRSTEEISPEKGKNVYSSSVSVHPNERYFTPGKYKIILNVSVCDPLEYHETEENGEKIITPLYMKNRRDFTKESYFDIE